MDILEEDNLDSNNSILGIGTGIFRPQLFKYLILIGVSEHTNVTIMPKFSSHFLMRKEPDFHVST